MRAGSKNAQEGMTLIEVLVALLILAEVHRQFADDQSGQLHRL
jgi:prepilin-type N-terminal cleavage/methylation domain-containing protein